MYIVQNAVKNLICNKGRNILMCAIIFTIIVTTVISLIINSTANNILDDYKAQFGSKVFIQPDTSKLQIMSGKSNQTVPLPEVYTKLAKSEDLLSADLSCIIPCTSDTIKGIGEDAGSNISVGSSNMDKFPSMNIMGYSSKDQLEEFKSGYRRIIKGSFYKNANECIVSQDFAKLNKISIGDIIKMEQGNVPGKTISLKVTGIYSDLTKNQFGDRTPAIMNRRNEIITDFTTADHVNGDWNLSVYSASYVLKNPSLLKAFEKEARAAGLSTDYLVTTDTEGYNKVVGPIAGLSKITFTFMTVVLVLGGIILILLSTIAIRERKYEIGVLRAMGMKKNKVAYGLISEALIITAACLVIGLGVGAVSAQPVSDMLLKNQVQAAENNRTQNSGTAMNYAGVQTDENEKTITEIDVGLNTHTIYMIILISFVLVTISSITGISYITKYEPIKILMERN